MLYISQECCASIVLFDDQSALSGEVASTPDDGEPMELPVDYLVQRGNQDAMSQMSSTTSLVTAQALRWDDFDAGHPRASECLGRLLPFYRAHRPAPPIMELLKVPIGTSIVA